MAKRVNKKFLVVLTSVVLVGGVTGMAAMYVLPKVFKKSAAEYTREAQKHEEKGELDAAIGSYMAAAGANKTDPALRVAIGDALNKAVLNDPLNYNKAKGAWEDALAVDPGYKPAMERLLDSWWDTMKEYPVPDTFTKTREAAERVLARDPKHVKAIARANIVTIRQAQANVTTKDADIQKAVQALRDLARQNPADPELPFWAAQGDIYLVLQSTRRASDLQDARDALAKLEPQIDAMLVGQENNAVMQMRAAQLYSSLAALEAQVGRPEDGEPGSPTTKGTTTRPAAGGARKPPAAVAKKGAAGAATSQPAIDEKQPAGRFTARVDAAIESAIANAKQGTTPAEKQDFIEIQLIAGDWLRARQQPDRVRKIVDDLVAKEGDDPIVRLAYQRAFKFDPKRRDDPAEREKLLKLLTRPVKYDGLSGMDALRRKNNALGVRVEACNIRLALAQEEKDPVKRKQIVDAVEADVKQIEAIPNPPVVALLELKGRLLIVQGKLTDAIATLQQAVDRGGGENANVSTMLMLAQAYLEANQTGQAEKLLRTICTRAPDYTPARIIWIEALIRDGRNAEAREELATLKKKAPDTKEIAPLTAQLEGGNTRTKFIQDLPESTPAERMRKSLILRADGKVDEALEQAELAFKEDPTYAPALGTLLDLYMAADRRDDAIAAVNQAIKASPNNEALKKLPERLKKRSPEELEKWQLEQINALPDALAREMSLFQFYAQKSAAAAQRGDEADRKKQGTEAEAHLTAAEKQKPDDLQILRRRFEFLMMQRRFDEAALVVQRLGAANVDEANGQLLRLQLALARRDFGAAEAAAREVTRQRPQFSQGWQFLGLVLQNQGRTRDAVRAYNDAIERQGRNYEALRGLAQCYYELNDPIQAKITIDRAREAFPTDPAFRELSLQHELNYGDPAKVVAERERIYKESPENPNAALALVQTYLSAYSLTPDKAKQKKALDRAAEILNAATKKWPTNSRFTGPLAQVKLKQGDFLGGEKLLKDYAAQDDAAGGDKLSADQMLADYYEMAGKPAMAEQSLREALAKTQGTPAEAAVHQRIAVLLANTGRMPEALKELAGLPGPEAARQRIEYLRATGKLDEAQAEVNAALKQNPNAKALSDVQLELLMNAGKFAEAEQVAQQRLSKSDADDTARYYSALIKLRKQPPEVQAAIKELNTLVDRNPRSASVYLVLADAHAAANDPAGAIDDLTKALQYAPLNREARLKLLDRCAASGQWASVIRLANEAVAEPRLGTNDPTWQRYLATAYAATKKYAEAEKAIERGLTFLPPEAQDDFLRERLNVNVQAGNFPKVIKLTDAMITKGQKPWWVYMYRGFAKNGLKDKTFINEFDASLKLLDPNKQLPAVDAVMRAIAQAAGPDAALKRIDPLEAKTPALALLAAELSFGKSDAPGALAHLKKLEPDADKLPLEIRLSFYRALGQCYYQQKPADLNNAVAAYQKFLTLSPGEVSVLNNLAYILAEEMKPPRPDAAKEFSKKAYDIALDWRRGDEKARVYDTHGWVLVLNGGPTAAGKDADEGVRILQEVAEQFPILEAHYHLGMAHLRRKNASEAEDQLTKAVALIAKSKKEKTPYDESLEPLVEKALSQAKALNAAAAR